MTKQKKLRAGAGAKCSIYTRFLHPKQTEYADQKDHRSTVVLVASEKMKVNRKQIDCYTCKIDGIGDVLHAAKSHFKMEEQGDPDKFFVPLTDEERKKEREAAFSSQFKEPTTKWKKSKAKKHLYEMILDGTIADHDCASKDLEEIYLMDSEFMKYDFGKFRERLSALRKSVHEMNDRAAEDEKAFEVYKSNHQPSLVTSQGYIQWQGSKAQDLLLEDIHNGKHKEMKPKELWESRKEYMEQYGDVNYFRNKLYQELRTAKYIKTLRERGLAIEKKT